MECNYAMPTVRVATATEHEEEEHETEDARVAEPESDEASEPDDHETAVDCLAECAMGDCGRDNCEAMSANASATDSVCPPLSLNSKDCEWHRESGDRVPYRS